MLWPFAINMKYKQEVKFCKMCLKLDISRCGFGDIHRWLLWSLLSDMNIDYLVNIIKFMLYIQHPNLIVCPYLEYMECILFCIPNSSAYNRWVLLIILINRKYIIRPAGFYTKGRPLVKSNLICPSDKLSWQPGCPILNINIQGNFCISQGNGSSDNLPKNLV